MSVSMTALTSCMDDQKIKKLALVIRQFQFHLSKMLDEDQVEIALLLIEWNHCQLREREILIKKTLRRFKSGFNS